MTSRMNYLAHNALKSDVGNGTALYIYICSMLICSKNNRDFADALPGSQRTEDRRGKRHRCFKSYKYAA